eukprot:TRINITY_DN26638_c0_g1_i1.p1 TRINITY_DN26638_c0_g1~~TRINITY_DN26638_c0_g1_i1.p1  ORF type:complete len:614 (+),score=98.92 TRINITY_DN26638_c0_g1_i1:50-1891(+)
MVCVSWLSSFHTRDPLGILAALTWRSLVETQNWWMYHFMFCAMAGQCAGSLGRFGKGRRATTASKRTYVVLAVIAIAWTRSNNRLPAMSFALPTLPAEDGWLRLLQCIGIVAGAALLIWCVISWLVGVIAKRAYFKLKEGNAFDMDAYVGDPNPSGKSCAKIMLGTRMNVGFRAPSKEALALGHNPSPFVKGLHVMTRLGQGDAAPFQKQASKELPIVVGTIRMGFGHHRIAYAAASWGIASGSQTYFHDFLNIDSQEAQLIRDTDKLYSKASRMASEMGGTVERMWGAMTKSGDENMLRATYQMAEHLKPLLLGLDRDTPIIATHSLVGLTAVACGFKRVINLVIDNHAQWFCIVPGALNLVQGPSNYHNFLKMGVKPHELQLAGHWIPKDLVDNVESDCAMRKDRLKAKAPCRLLIPVGGAGAQRKFVTSFVTALGPKVKAGKVQLFLNAADHAHMKDAFLDCLQKMGLEHASVDSLEGVRSFCDNLRNGGVPDKSVTLFAYDSYFPAVATTDLLCRVSDVLCSKPSELAFYPVPKLNIRRVGDHEAYSALRSSELGDGSLEVRELAEALRYVDLVEQTQLLAELNDCIVRNASIGVYNGCKTAVEIARGS